MYVRRDRSSLRSGAIFRKPQRRRMRWLGPAYGIVLILAGMVLWQFNTIQPAVLGMLGLAGTPTPTAMESARQGDLAFWRGDLNSAVSHYEQAAELVPANLSVNYELVRMLVYRSFTGGAQEQPDIQAAVDYAAQALEIAPNNARALSAYCLALSRAERTDEAVQHCNRAITFDPNNADAYAFLTQVYYDLARYQDAVEIGRKALDLNPNSIEANTAYGFLQFTSRTPEAGIPYFVRAAEYNKRLEFPYFNLAASAYAIGLRQGDPAMYQLATDAYDTILAMNKRSVKAYTGLCQLYFATGDRNLARDNCITATDLDPEFTPAWRWLGEINYLTTEYEDATRAFEECYQREAGLPVEQRQTECWVFRGLAYVQLGDCRTALPIFTETLSWIRSATAIERINKGIRICTGRSLVTPTPVPTPDSVPPGTG